MPSSDLSYPISSTMLMCEIVPTQEWYVIENLNVIGICTYVINVLMQSVYFIFAINRY